MPNIHPFILIIDYILGIIMWTLIGRVAMNIFQRENSEFFFNKNRIITPDQVHKKAEPGSALYLDKHYIHINNEKYSIQVDCIEEYDENSGFMAMEKWTGWHASQ